MKSVIIKQQNGLLLLRPTLPHCPRWTECVCVGVF